MEGLTAVCFLVLIVVLIVVVITGIVFRRGKCPKCGRYLWREEIRALKIPGSEHEYSYMPNPNELRTEIRARYRVLHKCRYCGHRGEEQEARKV